MISFGLVYCGCFNLSCLHAQQLWTNKGIVIMYSLYCIAYAADYRPPNVPQIELGCMIVELAPAERASFILIQMVLVSTVPLQQSSSGASCSGSIINLTNDWPHVHIIDFTYTIYTSFINLWDISSHYFTVYKINYTSTIDPTVFFCRMMHLLDW